MRSQKKRKWTVFFVIKSIDDSFDEMVTMVNEIRDISFGTDISILMCLNILKAKIPALQAGNPKPEVNSTSAITTVFAKLLPDPESENGFLNKLEITYEAPPERNFQITKAADLQEFFKHGIADNEAERYILFTWDHGASYGIYENRFMNFTETNPGSVNIPKIELRGKLGSNDQILTNEELNLAIKGAFIKSKIDLLIMMNCSMQFLDTGYALRETVVYLVASELIMDFNGYNYPVIFQRLSIEPGISSKKIAKIAVSSFSTKAFPSVALSIYQKHFTALFAVDLSFYNKLAELTDRLAFYLLAILDEKKKEIFLSKQNSLIDKFNGLVDFYSFIDQLEIHQVFHDNTLLLNLIKSTRDFILVKSYIGEGLKGKSTLSRLRPTGFTIYFPPRLESPQNPSNGFVNTAFFTATSWKRFLASWTDY